MDQKRIGQFIGQRRKEAGMTQKELADEIGVSDKTISKWETGNGLPDITMLGALCKVLEINVNELLSGEKLPSETYSEKAEENMMNLLKENQDNKKMTRFQWIWSALGVILLLFSLFLEVTVSTGVEGWRTILPSVLDLPSLLMIVLPIVGLTILSAPRNKREMVRAVRKQLLPVGLIGMIMGVYMTILYTDWESIDSRGMVPFCLQVASIPLLYAMIAYILFGVLEERFSHDHV